MAKKDVTSFDADSWM